jgi:DNA-directed RNA polymerase specialized sigma24 family protein
LDVALLAGEVKIKCMLGMLMCLGTKQRMVFILGSILGVNSRIGGNILGTTNKSFRKILSRSRTKIDNFLLERSGLFRKSRP